MSKWLGLHYKADMRRLLFTFPSGYYLSHTAPITVEAGLSILLSLKTGPPAFHSLSLSHAPSPVISLLFALWVFWVRLGCGARIGLLSGIAGIGG